MSSVIAINIQSNPECSLISLPPWLLHDLMQPFNALVLSAQVVNSQDCSRPTLQASIGTIIGSTTLMGSMLWSLREYLRLESECSPPILESVELSDIASKLQTLGKQLSIEKKLILNGFENLVVISSHVLLEILILCLYSNAAKYAKNIVSVSTTTEGGYVKINFKDDGPGVEEKVLERIGMPFNRSIGSVGGGLGLGIYLASRIAGKLNHKIEVESSSHGSEFSVIMKQTESGGTKRSNNAGAYDIFFGKKILILESDEIFSKALNRMFTSWGAVVSHCNSTHAAKGVAFYHVDIVVSSVDVWKESPDESRALVSRLSPEIILLSSEFENNSDAMPMPEEARRDARFFFIQRPFSPIRIRRVLGGLIVKNIGGQSHSKKN